MRKGRLQTAEQLPLRFLRLRPLGSLMNLTGVALGVGLVVAMTLLWHTFNAAVADMQRYGLGTYDFVMKTPDGYVSHTDRQQAYSYPSVGYIVEVLMVEPPAGADQQYIGAGEFPESSLAYPLSRGRYPGPGEFVVREELAAERGWSLGDRVTLPFQLGRQEVQLVGIRTATPEERGESPQALLFELDWLREQMDLPGRANMLLIRSAFPWEWDNIAGFLHFTFPQYQLWQRVNFVHPIGFLEGFSIWMRVVGVTVGVCSLLLVTGSFHIATRERWRELATLRSLGATPDQTVKLILREAALLGTFGSLVGVGFGWAVASLGLAAVASSTGIPAQRLAIPWLIVILEAGLGIALALIAARQPARESGRIPALAAMRHEAATPGESLGKSWYGLWIMGAGLLLILIATQITGYARFTWSLLGVALFAAGLVVASSLVLAPVVRLTAMALRPFLPVEARIGSTTVLRHRRRSGHTISIMILSTLLIVVLSTMNTASQDDMLRLIQSRIPYDAALKGPVKGSLPPEVLDRVRQIPGIREIAVQGQQNVVALVRYDWGRADQEWLSEVRSEPDRPPSIERRVQMTPVDPVLMHRFGLVDQPDGVAGLVVLESHARRWGIQVGDPLTFVTPEQSQIFAAGGEGTLIEVQVSAIVESMPSGHFMWIPSTLLEADPEIIYLDMNPARAPETAQAIRDLLVEMGLGMASFSVVAEESDVIVRFHRQFWVLTVAGGVTALLVGFLSLITAIVAGLHARRRELATLRAIGSTPWQMARLVMVEASFVSIAGGILALLASSVAIVAFVVGANLESFNVAVAIGGGAVGLGILLSCLVALGPGLAVTRGSAAEVLRLE